MAPVTRRMSAVRFEPVYECGGWLSEYEYEQRRDITTACELEKLEASPQFKKWKRRFIYRRQAAQALASLLALALLSAGGVLLVQHVPLDTLKGALHMPASTDSGAAYPAALHLPALAETPVMREAPAAAETPVMREAPAAAAAPPTAEEVAQRVAAAHRRQVEGLEGELASLRGQVEQQGVQLQAALAAQQAAVRAGAEGVAREERLRKAAEAEAQREREARAQAEAAHAARLQDAEWKLRRAKEAAGRAAAAERAGAAKRAAAAEQAAGAADAARQPALSASVLGLTLLALVATSALAFWHSAAGSARRQAAEIEELRLQAEEQRLQAEAQEARLVQEKSMIGRLQRELVTLNRARMDWEDTLLASGRGLVRKQAEVNELEEQLRKRDAESSSAEEAQRSLAADCSAAQADRDRLQQANAALQERLSAAESRNFQLEAFAAAAAGPSAGNGASQQQQLSPTADKENSGNGGLRGGSNTAAALAGPSKALDEAVPASNAGHRAQPEGPRLREVALTQQVAKHAATEKGLRREIAAAQAALQQQRRKDAADAAHLVDEIQELQRRETALTQQVAQHAATEEGLRRDIAAAQAALQQQQKDAADAAHLVDEIQELQQRETALTQQVAQHAAAEEGLRHDIAVAQTASQQQREEHAAAAAHLAGQIEELQAQLQGALAAAAAAEEERRECVADMRALLDAQIATTTAVLDHAAVEKAVAEARHAALIPAAAAVLLLVYAAITVESHCTLWRRILSRILAELGERVEQLQGERAALAAQLADTEAERDAAAGAAAAASAEAAAADRLNRLLEEEVAALDGDVAAAAGEHAAACEHVRALLVRLTERRRYEDAEVELERSQAQVQELQRVRLQLEAQVESLAARLQDADAKHAALQAEVAALQQACKSLDAQLVARTAELGGAVEARGRLSGLLEAEAGSTARLQRSQANLEGQVEQLTISLADAASKKSDAEMRLRQYQQDLVQMELLMGRAEEERRALEAEVAAMRASAGAAAPQLLLAEEEVSRDVQSVGAASPALSEQQSAWQAPAASTGQAGSAAAAAGAAAKQTPMTAALTLMQKMEGVARLLGGNDILTYPSPRSRASTDSSRATSPGAKPASGSERMLHFMGRAAGKLGNVSSHMTAVSEDECDSVASVLEGLPATPLGGGGPLATPLQHLELAAARVSLEVTPGPVLQAAQQEQEARFVRLQPKLADAAAQHGSSSSALEADLARLRGNMHAALRAALAQDAPLQGAASAAARAAEAAVCTDAAHAAAQAAVEALVDERASSEDSLSQAAAAVAVADAGLEAAAARKAAADAALQEFEAKGLGAFGGSAGASGAVWRERVDAQDAFAAAAQAKAAALQGKEDAMLAKKALLGRLEAAIHALGAADAASDVAAEAAGDAAADLDAHVQMTIEAQQAFEAARAAFAEAVAEASAQLGVQQPQEDGSSVAVRALSACSDSTAAPVAAAQSTVPQSTPATAARLPGPDVSADSSVGPDSSAARPAMAKEELPDQAQPKAGTPLKAGAAGGPEAGGSPGSVENQPQRANQNQNPSVQSAGDGPLLGLPGLLRAFKGGVFKSAPLSALGSAADSSSGAGAHEGGPRGRPMRSRRTSGEPLGSIGPGTAEKSLAAMDNSWSGSMH